jgi:histidinol dehydrogenase
MYLKISTNPNVVIVNYYKLISDDGLNYLNQKLDKIGFSKLNYDEFNNALNQPAKHHGKSVKNANEALERYHRVQEEFKEKVFNSDLVHSLNPNMYTIFDDL